MNVLEINEVGKFIRKKRKEQGLRLEDLSDEQISTATISNIERGVPHVNREKVIYLMEKMGIKINDIPQLLEQDNESMESIHLKVVAIDTMIKIGSIEQAQAALARYHNSDLAACEAVVRALKGRCHIALRDWKKAERELSEAIRLSSQDPLTPRMNLEAACYENLSYCRAEQSAWDEALRYTQRGLQVFVPAKNQYDQVVHGLIVNQVVCLQNLGRTDEALRILEDLWRNIDAVQNRELLLHMYMIRADLFNELKLYHDAIHYAREGVQLAVRGNYVLETFRLWSILGKACLHVNRLQDAEVCFEFARDFSERIPDGSRTLGIHVALGELYLLQEKWDLARTAFKMSIELSEKYNEPVYVHKSMLSMGQLMYKMKRTEESIQYLERSVGVAEKHGLHEALARSYYELAGCFKQLDFTEEYHKSVEKMYLAQKTLQHEQEGPGGGY